MSVLETSPDRGTQVKQSIYEISYFRFPRNRNVSADCADLRNLKNSRNSDHRPLAVFFLPFSLR